jgi:hypothetical protein
LAWLHTLITDVLGVQRAKLPESPENNTITEAHNSGVYSDPMSPGGHSVAIYDEGLKMISHSAAPEQLSGARKENELFRIEIDRSGRVELESIEDEFSLIDVDSDLFTTPESLQELGSKLENDVEDRLEELGYID